MNLKKIFFTLIIFIMNLISFSNDTMQQINLKEKDIDRTKQLIDINKIDPIPINEPLPSDETAIAMPINELPIDESLPSFYEENSDLKKIQDSLDSINKKLDTINKALNIKSKNDSGEKKNEQ